MTVLHRKPSHDLGQEGRRTCRPTATTPQRCAGAVAGQSFDVVFDNAYDWERGTTAAQVGPPRAPAATALHRYVFMSSVAAYGDGLNHHEGDALAPDDHPDPYVRNKAHERARCCSGCTSATALPVVTLRPPFVYGPGNPFYREQFFWDRLRDKRPHHPPRRRPPPDAVRLCQGPGRGLPAR